MSAPRWLRALGRGEAVLQAMPGGETGYGVWRAADRRRRPVARVSCAQLKAAEAAGWLERRGEARVLSATGRAHLAAEAGEGLSGRRELTARWIMERTGPPRRVMANRLEGPLGRWRAALGPAALEAGESFLRDYVRSSLLQPVTRNWSPTAPRRGETRRTGPEDAAIGAMMAKQRVMAALEAIGPRRARLVEAVIIREESAAAMERRFGWPARTGKAAVIEAFEALARHYRLG